MRHPVSFITLYRFNAHLKNTAYCVKTGYLKMVILKHLSNTNHRLNFNASINNYTCIVLVFRLNSHSNTNRENFSSSSCYLVYILLVLSQK